VLSWRDDQSLQVRGSIRGFEILSRGRGGTRPAGSDEDCLPELFVRGAAIYTVQLNAQNPVGTVQSIEHALRSLEKAAEQEQDRAARAEKMLADYREQMGKPFEHEARLKELLGRQAELNAALDLDKGERQVAPEAGSGEREADGPDAGTAEEHERRRVDHRRRPETKSSAVRPAEPQPMGIVSRTTTQTM